MGHTGLFIGGGGGRGGYQLAGSGLMLRGDAGLTYETAGYGNFGFGISHVRFPSGVIFSTQPYFQYDYVFNSILNPGWDITTSSDGSRAATDTTSRHTSEFSLAGFNYKIPSSVVVATGQPQRSSMQLFGVEWTSYLNDNWFLKLQSAGAMGGQNNGYMQILAGGGYRLPLSQGTALKFSAGAGPAGGGGVDTGGGLLLDADVSLQQSLTRRIAIELAVGQLRAPSQSFQARSVSIKANYRFDLPSATSGSVTADSVSGYDAKHLRIRVANQTYFKAAPQWRNQFADQPVHNLGIQLDYFLTPRFFMTGQGLAAYAGKAGAYMTGQVGVGIHQPVSEDFFTEAEMLLGAAGGGGLAVGGGLVGQANASLGYQYSKPLSLLASAGRIESVTGNFKANVVGLSLAYQFTGFIKK